MKNFFFYSNVFKAQYYRSNDCYEFYHQHLVDMFKLHGQQAVLNVHQDRRTWFVSMHLVSNIEAMDPDAVPLPKKYSLGNLLDTVRKEREKRLPHGVPMTGFDIYVLVSDVKDQELPTKVTGSGQTYE